MSDADITLNPEQTAVLALIGRRGEQSGARASLGTVDIARELDIEEIQAVRAVEALSAFGLVATEATHADGRTPARILGLTDAGRARVRPAQPGNTGGGGAW